MKNFLIYPFKMSMQEIKRVKQVMKESESKGIKLNIYPFMYMTYMFLIVFSLLHVSVIYFIIGGIFVTPVVFIPVIPTIITILIARTLYTRVYPKTKENYLESIGFYKERY